MECGASSTAFPNSKRKAALDEDLSDGEDAVAVDAAAPPVLQQQNEQGGGDAAEEAPMRPKAIRIMSQEWIDSVLVDTIKPLPFKERQLRDPKLAAIFHAHEKSRASFVEYHDWSTMFFSCINFLHIIKFVPYIFCKHA